MDFIFLGLCVGLFVFVGAIFAFQGRSEVRQLKQQVSRLELNISRLESRLSSSIEESINLKETHLSNDEVLQKNHQEVAATANLNSEQTSPWQKNQQPIQTSHSFINDTVDFVQAIFAGKGLFWLGAIVLALGGVFLAKYSIEAGLLPASVRLVLGSAFGIALIICAQLAQKFKDKLNINGVYISAALASGGVITCFAMVFVAYQSYSFIGPQLAFILLAVIALAASSLALRFGPLLAAIGGIGAYLVPALVNTGSNDVAALLFYVAFVSASNIWVANKVQQSWLWWLSFVGHFIWFALSTFLASEQNLVAICLFALVSLYYYVFSSVLGWRLQGRRQSALTMAKLLFPRKEQAGAIATAILLLFYLLLNRDVFTELSIAMVVTVVAVIASYRHSAFDTWPFVALLFNALIIAIQSSNAIDPELAVIFVNTYIHTQVSAIVLLAYSYFMLSKYPDRAAFALLLVLAPLLLYGASFVFSGSEVESQLYMAWSIELLIIAATFSYLLSKKQRPLHIVSFSLLINACISLTLTMLLSASVLTLAISIQLASMSYLSSRYKVQVPNWLYKVALTVIVGRLTLAPWLASYQGELIFNLHWTLIIYPLVLVLIGVCKKYQTDGQLQQWFSGVQVQLVALLFTTEAGYMLTGSYPNLFDLSFVETVTLSLIWLVLAFVYRWRGQLSLTSQPIYRIAANALLIGFSLCQLSITVFNNPFLQKVDIGAGWLNWLWLMWLLPVIIIAIAHKLSQIPLRINKLALVVSLLLGFMFINGEIRALYHGSFIHLSAPTSQAELYTYSIVWLLLGTLTIFCAHYFNNQNIKRIGLGIIAVVVLKVFLIDMAKLQGLLRAISFIGLGLALIAIGWLFQRLVNSNKQKLA